MKSLINAKKPLELLTDDESIINNILLNIYNILMKNDLVIESLSSLISITFSMHHFDLSIQLLYFIHKIKNTDRYIFFNTIYQIYSPTITPKVIFEFKESQEQKNILTILANTNTNKQTTDFFIQLLNYEIDNNLYKINSTIPNSRILLHTSRILLKKEKYNNIISQLEPNIQSFKNISHIYEECIVMLYKSYSEMNEVSKCIDLFVNNYFYNKNLLNNIDTKKEINFFNNLGYKKSTINIDLIIFLHICKANSKTTAIVYRMLMRKLQFNKPSELDYNSFDLSKVIYFFRSICVQGVLSKDVLHFKTSNDVEFERVKICQLLLSIDKDNSSVYNEEIIDITQNIKIKERMREVDNSKIYTDFNGLINFDLKDFEKNFSRFKKINDLREKTSDEFNILIYDNKDMSLESTHEYKKKYLTLQEQLYSIYIELFIDIRDKYLFSNEHGLDAYLSTRIRHGTITGQLRKTFSDLNLITTKDKKTNIYVHNNYWIGQLSVNKKEYMDNIDSIMNKFSKDIDDYITYITDAYIQIKTENTSYALFDFSIYKFPKMLQHEFYNFFIECKSSDEFINRSMTICKNISEKNLAYIKVFFNSEIKKYFLTLLDDLEKDINIISNESEYALLLHNIRQCRTDIQTTIEIVSSIMNP